MRSGDLRHRVTIQSRSTSQDSFGQELTTWSDVATVWAAVVPLTGRELLAAAAINAELTHTVTIRYQAQFANPIAMAKMRIQYGTRLFNIQSSIDQNERHILIDLGCAEGLNNG